jgi:hypothetical protein
MLSYQALLTAVPVVLAAGNVPAIVGEAGIGKSALVQEVAQQMGAKLFTTVVSLSEKGDLAMPVPPLTERAFVKTSQYGELADVQFGYTHTLIEIIQWAEAHPGQPIIWFLDEFNRGTQAVQSELMNLVLQRRINTLQLPNEVKLILAENPDATMAGFEDSDYGVVSGDAAINDRTVRLVMRAEVADWLKWAKTAPILPTVQQFIAENPGQLAPKIHDADLYPTPRAWQRVSQNLASLATVNVADRSEIQLELLVGDLGETVGREFDHYLTQHQVGLTAQAIYDSTTLSTAVLDQFRAASPDQQQTIMTGLIDQRRQYPLTTAHVALRFNALLATMPADGQVAVALRLAEIPQLLETLADAALTQPGCRQLYDQLTAIGLDNATK